jgi:hypothetical protein
VDLPKPETYPLSTYFLSEYLRTNPNDSENFPPDQFPDGFMRYEILFHDALVILVLSKEALKARQEFNIDSGDANNLESSIAILRVVIHLRQAGFSNISLITPKRNSKGADLTAERNEQKVCFEVKTITKRSRGRTGFFLADQLFEKILEGLPTARRQPEISAAQLGCTLQVYVCVFNWFDQSIYLGQRDYQAIVDKLEKNEEQESLVGIDGVWFVTKMGQQFGFLNEHGKSLEN